jgi:D-tyrosyl-tRNA(Tyr) deacylase
MIGLLQRVSEARVVVEGECIAAIEAGILALVAVEGGDAESHADRLIDRLVNYRIFPDAQGRMNLSLLDVAGGMLLVPQFTLAADTRKGNRPSFSSAASPEEAARLFDYCVARAARYPIRIAAGRFGADMKVTLTNDGPVTLWLRVPPGSSGDP